MNDQNVASSEPAQNNNIQTELSTTPKGLNKKLLIIAISILLILIVAGVVGYLFIQGKTSKTIPSQSLPQQGISEPTKTSQYVSQDNPSVVALENGDLYNLQINDLSSKKLTSGGGFATSNQYSYWFSPDRTRLISKQNKTLLLITKDGAKSILSDTLKGNVDGVAWRSDSNGLVLLQTLKYQETGIGGPALSEILTYDLETGKTSKIKEFTNEFAGVVLWDKDTNVIGYTTGGGEGGAFGNYHVLNLNIQDDKTYQTRWINPGSTPDQKEFIVFQDYDGTGNSQDTVKIYSLLNPDKPLRTFPSPKKYFRCSPQIASNALHPNTCLGVGKSFWFVDGNRLKSFDTQTGIIADITSLPSINIDVPNQGNTQGNVVVLDVSKDQKVALLEQQISFSRSEYKIYDLSNGQVKSLGFTKGGTTQPIGTTGQESEFWTYEALGFLY